MAGTRSVAFFFAIKIWQNLDKTKKYLGVLVVSDLIGLYPKCTSNTVPQIRLFTLLLANWCLSDAPGHNHIRFGLPKWSMFLLVLVHQHCPTCSWLSLRPKTFAQQADEINCCLVDCTRNFKIFARETTWCKKLKVFDNVWMVEASLSDQSACGSHVSRRMRTKMVNRACYFHSLRFEFMITL